MIMPNQSPPGRPDVQVGLGKPSPQEIASADIHHKTTANVIPAPPWVPYKWCAILKVEGELEVGLGHTHPMAISRALANVIARHEKMTPDDIGECAMEIERQLKTWMADDGTNK